MKKLPVGISTFSKIIEDNCIYVDKTEYIYEMLSAGNLYFLSRPRRFGKSLLISTLEEIFKGNKELFKGLFIYDNWDWDKNYPIIKLDFGNISHKNPEQLEKSLEDFINQKARDYSIDIISKTLTSKFAELIEEIYKISNNKVVILIDEYDKAINSHLDNIEIAKKNRDILRDFYQVLKANDAYIEFILITGVSKFVKTSIFSELNNLNDITVHHKYAKICGYSQQELEIEFKDHIKEIANEKATTENNLLSNIKKWYNGYSWDGKNFLYNPFSILNFLDTGKFSNYWAQTGTPKVLVDLIKKSDIDLDIFTNEKIALYDFPNFDLENLDFTTVLLQTGYLTIKEEELFDDEYSQYLIAIPNKEVKDSLFSYILSQYTNQLSDSLIPMTKTMLTNIIKLDSKSLQRSFEILLHKIPNILYGDIKKESEAYYKILFMSWIQLLGFEIKSEIQTIKGRLDAILEQKNLVLIIEFKFSLNDNLDDMIENAFNQIVKKEYYKPYQNKKVILLAVAFKSRDIKCQLKTLEDSLNEYN
ncbi:ATP-binding protein [Methanobrevibacter curvatus]|uniref:Putative AAA-ATPase n=1 Tax=Methanobrevibacter curvatus TaxID=49547 RepID=A0A166AHG3_9EURY|nr:ATP-binding protein [Methanobrevibacter curvatus]KZX12038.1 putative AAA-ATPase [Methanobrevibacter curvatus]